MNYIFLDNSFLEGEKISLIKIIKFSLTATFHLLKDYAAY